MELQNFRRDIIIETDALYNKCLEGDVVSCDVCMNGWLEKYNFGIIRLGITE